MSSHWLEIVPAATHENGATISVSVTEEATIPGALTAISQVDRAPERQRGPQYPDLARLVLEHATTTREGVDLIGELIAEHGYSTFGGNT